MYLRNYLENQVKNAHPLDHVIMLYNRAIACLKIAKKAIEDDLKDPENIRKKAENIGKATEIIAYLQGSLNMEKGGEIAKSLKIIYDILIGELVKANLENNTEIIVKSIITLENLKKAWEEVKVNLNGKL